MRPTGSDILVVDDEADIRDLVSGLLEDEGHSVRVASNSDEALAAIDEEVADGHDGVRADVAFHRTIAQATGNPYFIRTLEFVSQSLETATRITRTNEARREDFSRQVHEEHQAIVAAIRLGDPLAAANAARARDTARA